MARCALVKRADHIERRRRGRLLPVTSAVILIAACTAFEGSVAAGGAGWQPTGRIGPGVVTALAVDSRDPQIVYAGSPTVWRNGEIQSSGTLHRSADGGRTWLKTRLVGVTAMVAHPRVAGTAYVATEFDGVFKTTDHGRTWLATNRGLGDFVVESLAIDAASANVVYAGTGWDYGDGVFKSANGGRRWRAFGLSDYFVNELAIDSRTQTLYAAAWDPQFAHDPNLLAVSRNAGRSWMQQTDRTGITSLAAHPRAANTVFVATSRGVLKSTDGARMWRLTGLRHSGVSVLVHPQRSRVLYAAGRGRGVFTSANGGRTWSALNRGLPDLDITSIAIAGNGRVLYAGTPGGVFVYRTTT